MQSFGKEANSDRLRKLAAVAEKTQHSATLMDVNGCLLWANEAFYRMSGYSPEEVVGRNPIDFLSGSLTDAHTLSAIAAATEEGTSFSGDVLNYAKDGRRYWIQLTIDPIFDQGEIEGYVGVGADVTEKHALRERIAQNEAQFRTLLDSLTEVVFEVDDRGRFLFLNSAWEKLSGYPVARSLGRSMLDFTFPDEREKYLAEWGEYAKLGRSTSLLRFRIHHADGSERWVDCAATLDYSLQGEFVHARGTLSDVTEAVDVYRKLESDNRFTRAVLDTADTIILVLDRTGRVEEVNRACETITGLGETALVGKNFFQMLIPEEDLEDALSSFADMVANGVPKERLRRWRTIDGSVRLISTKNACLFDAEGRVDHVIVCGSDVTEQLQAQSELETAKERYEIAVKGSHDAIWDLDMSSGLYYFAPRFGEMLGIAVEDIPKDREEFKALCHPEDLKRTEEETFHQLRDRNGNFSIEYRLKNAQGDWIWVQSRGAAVLDAEGNMARLAGSITEITEQKRIIEALKESEARFKQVAQALKVVIWITDVESSRVLYVSPPYEEMWGLSSEHLYRDSAAFLSSVHPSDLPKVRKAFTNHDTTKSLQYRVVRGDGEVRWVRSRMYPVFGVDGTLVRVVGIAEDVTESEEYRRALERSEKLLAESQRLARLGSWELDLDNRRIIWSEQSFELFERDPALGAPSIGEYLEGLEERIASEIYRQHVSAIRRGTPVNYEIVRQRADGLQYLQVIGEPVFNAQGRVEKLQGSVQDVSQIRVSEIELLRTREQALQASRMKSDFLANISHEIRTPLNGVIGMADLLLESNLGSEQQEWADTIRTSAENLLRILNDILDISKIESGRLTLNPEPVDLVDVIEEVAEMFAHAATAKGLQMRLDIDWHQPSKVIADKNRLRQVLSNLVNNALKFTLRGEVVLGLRMLKGGSVAEIWVQDTGVGIPQERQDEIYENFVQADGSATRRFGGTGLGLAIVRQLVDLMHGRIELVSQPGEGTCFTVRIAFDPPAEQTANVAPLQGFAAAFVGSSQRLKQARDMLGMLGLSLTDQKPALIFVDLNASSDELHHFADLKSRFDVPVVGIGTSMQQPEFLCDELIHIPLTRASVLEKLAPLLGIRTTQSVVHSSSRKPRALLAEDNAVNRRVVLHQLEKQGFDVDVAENGREAVSMAIATQYDLILMDIQMPELDGIDAALEIRKHESQQSRHTPIVAITAFGTSDKKALCMAAGMDDYMAKPLQVREFQLKVEQWSGSAASGAAKIDRDYLQDVSGGDPEFERELMRVYRSSAPQLVVDLVKMVNGGEVDEAMNIAHTLKGSSRSIGANQFAQLCEQFEDSAKTSAQDKLELSAKQIQRSFAMLLAEVEQFCSS